MENQKPGATMEQLKKQLDFVDKKLTVVMSNMSSAKIPDTTLFNVWQNEPHKEPEFKKEVTLDIIKRQISFLENKINLIMKNIKSLNDTNKTVLTLWEDGRKPKK